MRQFLATITCGITLLIGSVAGTNADPDSCRDAAGQFKSAQSDVETAISTYASCVSDSDGHDDCSSEASTVQSDQSDFESAVSEYESECQ